MGGCASHAFGIVPGPIIYVKESRACSTFIGTSSPHKEDERPSPFWNLPGILGFDDAESHRHDEDAHRQERDAKYGETPSSASNLDTVRSRLCKSF